MPRYMGPGLCTENKSRSPEGPRLDRQQPRRVSLLSRPLNAVDEASIYGIEAGSGCVRQYSYRTTFGNLKCRSPVVGLPREGE
jgi:hypothetical protein